MTHIVYIIVIKNFAIAIMDTPRFNEFYEIITRYTDSAKKSHSHIVFDTQPVNPEDITYDLLFFRLECENESLIDEKLNRIIEDLNGLDTDYSLMDDDTGKMIVALDFVGMLKIKFDNVECIEKGTYKKIDELKQTKNEFGYCKGYKPNFRPMESKPIKDSTVQDEKIFLFSDSQENLSKLTENLCEKVMKIDSALETEFAPFT